MLSVLGWAETMRFGSSSTEMVQAALRMARATTGRTGIVRFHGHYHGWIDNIYTRNEGTEAAPASKGQPASALTDVIPIEWNDIQAFEQVMAEHGSETAAVIMEPIMINAGVILPDPGYLEAVRRICQQHGTVLIFDETISGFRVALGGAAERYGVHPDLAVYGKAMAAGWPCAAIAGRRDLFADVTTGEATHAGTFNGNTIATAAVLARSTNWPAAKSTNRSARSAPPSWTRSATARRPASSNCMSRACRWPSTPASLRRVRR